MSATTPGTRTIDRDRVAALAERQRALYRERTARSGELYARASRVMPGGVPSSFQRNDPWPVYLQRGEGARVWDVDGSEYVDFHNGFGVMCVGHANPAIAAAVKAQMDGGTHFAAAAGACRSGASRTPARSRRWMPSTSRAGSPGER
jgi:glutamate-1-semialdehyde 2,1-aminomutase